MSAKSFFYYLILSIIHYSTSATFELVMYVLEHQEKVKYIGVLLNDNLNYLLDWIYISPVFNYFHYHCIIFVSMSEK